jgi:large subunit ribosomal protein L10e
MARLKKFCAYRRLERPYTRVSKFRKKSFIRATPNTTITHFDMGSKTKKFGYRVDLVSKSAFQIRHNALESSRMTCNRLLESNLGKGGYRFKIRPYPFHILRENPLAAGAGADRMSTGMKMSFGKPISVAVQLKKGQTLMSVNINKTYLDLGKKALKRASYKLPGSYLITVTELPKK